MSGFDARLERLELKYLVDERTASRIRVDIAPYCRLDAYSVVARDGQTPGYPITSLYLDSPGLAFHRAKERGDAERVKLRVRTYDSDSPAILEIKQRSSDIVGKSRARIDRSCVEAVARGGAVEHANDPDSQRTTDNFAALALQHGAEPSLRVRYRREAWVSEVDDYARVTFDRLIEAQRASSWALGSGTDAWVAFDDHWSPEQRGATVVLELKCHTVVPAWITEVIQRHRLRRTSFSKYSIGVSLTERERGFDGRLRRSAMVMK